MMKKRLLLALKLGVSVLLLGWLLGRLGAESVLDVLAGADKRLLALGGLCLLGQTAISALKWRVLLRSQGQRVPYLSLFVTYLIGGFINLFMPSVAGGDAYRAVWLRRHTRTIAAAVPSIIVERASGVAALLVLASVGLALLRAPQHWGLVLLGLAALAAVTYLLVAYPFADRVARLPRGSWFGTAGIASDVLHAVRPTAPFALVMLLSFVFQLNTVLINGLYSMSMDLAVSPAQLLIVVPIVYLVETIPISLNGVGIREGTFTVLFAQLGLPPEQGLALGLMVTLMRYVVGLIGGTLLTVSVLRRPVAAGTPP